MTFLFPKSYIPDMGTVPAMTVRDKSGETAEEEALWQINRMREHDGLRPLSRIPRTIRMKIVED